MDDQQWCNLLSTQFCRNNLICIVIDQAHLVSWGVPSEDSEKAFREAFSRINTIRSFCGEHVPVLALSATVDKDISHLISSLCGMSRKLCTIFTSSDRKNIKLSMVNIKSKNMDCFRWVLDQVRLLKEKCPKILIYCRTQTLVGWLFEKFIFSLKNEAYKDGIKISSNLLIGMYHSCTLDANKNKVLDSLSHETVPRIIIATSALGCGVNAKNLKYVFHFGPAFSLIDYCQQIGRAGRSGEVNAMLFCILFPNVMP